MMTINFNLRKIRTLLTEGFTAEELRRLCYDESDFRLVYDWLNRDTGKADIIDRLLEHAEQKRLIEKLLAWTEENNPDKYREGQPYAESSITTDSAPSRNDSTPPKKVLVKLSKEEDQYPPVEQIKHLTTPPIDFLIITPLEEERDALLKKLPNPKKLDPIEDDIHIYFEANLSVASKNDFYRLMVMPLLNMGRVQAATATNDAIRRWQPRYIILVGIAGGLAVNKVSLGDILIPDKIIDYELQKQTAEGTDIRWEVYNVNPRLLSAAKNFLDESWLNLIQVKRPQRGQPKRHIGPIASGDKVIDFVQTLDRYRATWSKLIGVEMEAGGVALSILQTEKQTGFFMIRGVSDLADGDKNSSNVKKWRLYASDVAASYTIALLQSWPVPFAARQKPTPLTKHGINRSELILGLWENGICVKEFILGQETTYLIGRSERCQFQIDYRYDMVSRRHARIKRTRGKVFIFDGDGATSSRYGTFVNGVSVNSEQGIALSYGDQIVLGGFYDVEQQLISDGACLLIFGQQTLVGGK